MALVVNLPKDGAFYASRLGGPQWRGWNEDRAALAEMVDALNVGNHYFLMANRNPDKPKPKPPRPFPRPGDDDVKPAAPKKGSFAAMVVAAKKAQRLKRENMHG